MALYSQFVMVFLVLLFTLGSSLEQTEMVEKINNIEGNTWKAKEYPQWANLSKADLKKSLGLMNATYEGVPKNNQTYENVTLPAEFDSRTRWPGCTHDILNQEQCGSCWAFGASEAASFRWCIHGYAGLTLSPEELTACATTAYAGCHGAQMSSAWKYMVSNGLHTIDCIPYVDGNGQCSSCVNTQCTNPASSNKYAYKLKNWYGVSWSGYSWTQNENKIMQEVYTNGPVEVQFQVYYDLYQYHGGVYMHRSGNAVGQHAVELLGWGTDNGYAYWLLANSWGKSWGESGYFRVYRAEGYDLGLANYAVTGLPSVADV